MKIKNKKILIVDDESNILDSLELILSSKNYDVMTAKNGHLAFDKILSDKKKKSIDLVITDILMPEFSGVDLLKEMNKANINIPTLVITGHGEKDSLTEILKVGCNGFLEKPFNDDELLLKVDNIFKSQYKNKLIKVQNKHRNDSSIFKEIELPFKSIFNSFSEYIYSVKYQEGIKIEEYHNPGSIKITGFSEEDFKEDEDLWINIIHSEDRKLFIDHINKSIEYHQDIKFDYRIITKNGNIKWVLNIGSVVIEENNIIRINGVIIDITDRKRNEGVKSESEDLIKNIFNKLNINILVINCEYNIKTVNPLNNNLLGFKGSEILDKSLLDFIYPEDQIWTRCFLNNLITNKNVLFQIQVRLIKKNSKYFWGQIKAAIEKKAPGIIYILLEEIDEYNDKVRQIINYKYQQIGKNNSNKDNIFFIYNDILLNLDLINKKVIHKIPKDISLKSSLNAVNKDILVLIEKINLIVSKTDEIMSKYIDMKERFTDERKIYEITLEYATMMENELIEKLELLKTNASQLSNEEILKLKGKLVDKKKEISDLLTENEAYKNEINKLSLMYSTVILHDSFLEDELDTQLKEAQKLSVTDHLTQIYNRRKFHEILNTQIDKKDAEKYKKLSLIMFDIDHFKLINDNFGHDYGDYVLKCITEIIFNNLNENETFARWGGEEFIILIPETTLNQAVNKAEEMRKSIEETQFKIINRVTCSFGVTQLFETDDKNTLLKRVDKALYDAKNDGRNCVRFL